MYIGCVKIGMKTFSSYFSCFKRDFDVSTYSACRLTVLESELWSSWWQNWRLEFRVGVGTWADAMQGLGIVA